MPSDTDTATGPPANKTNPTGVKDAQDATRKLLGSIVRCTLDDGRHLEGTFVCLDRLKNIILCDVTETRKVPLADYGAYIETLDPPHLNSIRQKGDEGDVDENGCVTVTRKLGQACAPGARLAKVEVTRKTWEKSLASSLSSPATAENNPNHIRFE